MYGLELAIPIQRVTPHIHVLRPLGQMNTFVIHLFKFAPGKLSRPLGHLSETMNAVGRAASS
jgi:hypothetical protein